MLDLGLDLPVRPWTWIGVAVLAALIRLTELRVRSVQGTRLVVEPVGWARGADGLERGGPS